MVNFIHTHLNSLGVLSLGLIMLSSAPAIANQNFLANSAGSQMLAQIPPPGMKRGTLTIGSQGAEVSELQATLKLLGYYPGEVDGVYGESTAVAVSAFQQAAGLTADGVVNASTWEQLFPSAPKTATVTPATTATTNTAAKPSSTSSTTPVTRPSNTSTRTTSPNRTARANTRSTTSAKPTNTTTAKAPSSPQITLVELPILRVGMRGPAISGLQERLRATGFYKGAIDGVFGAETQAAVKAAQRSFKLDTDGIVGPSTWTALMR